MNNNLANAQVGDVCLVTEIAQEPVELEKSLYALGVIPGASIQILRVAPLGVPCR